MSQLATNGRTARPSAQAPARHPRTAVRPSASSSRLTTPPTSRRVEAVSGTGRSGAGFIVLVGLIALFGVIALLMLNTMRAEQSFTVQRLQSDVTTLQQRQQQLQSDLSAVSSPENLAVKADELGMVKAPSVKYVRASDHKTLGVSVVNGAGQSVDIVTLPDTPASKVAEQMLASGAIGAHITDPVEAAAAAAKQKAEAAQKAAAQKAEAEKKTAEAKKDETTTTKH